MSFQLINDRLFCMVFGTLRNLYPSTTQLNPVEVWMAAKAFTLQLNNCLEPGEIVEMMVEGLVIGNEEPDHAIILIISICQLSALRKDNAAELITLLLPYCQEHELFEPMLQTIGRKEHEMAQVGKKVEIMHYAFLEIEEEMDRPSINMVREVLDMALTISPDEYKTTLLALSVFNIKHENKYDPEVLDLFNHIMARIKPNLGIGETRNNGSDGLKGLKDSSGSSGLKGSKGDRKGTQSRIVEEVFSYRWINAKDGQLRLLCLYQKLIHPSCGFLEAHTSPEDWCDLFMGKPRAFTLKWHGTQALLKYLFKLMLQRGYIITPKGVGPWEVVGSHFLNAKSKPFSCWNDQKDPTRGAEAFSHLADLLNIASALD